MSKPVWKGWTTPEEYAQIASVAETQSKELKEKIIKLVELLEKRFPECYNRAFLTGALWYCKRVLTRGLFYGFPSVLPVVDGFVKLAEEQCMLPCSRRWHKRDLEHLDIVFQVVEDTAVKTKLYPRLEDMTLEDFGLGGKSGSSSVLP